MRSTNWVTIKAQASRKSRFPPLAGHSPTATARQLFDFRSGTRNGKNAAAMKPVVTDMTDADIVDVSAYIASLHS